jgi:GT2 family glycosyltransferase
VPGFSITNFRRVRDVAPDAPEPVVAIDSREFRLGLTPSTLLVDKAVFEQVGRFDPELGSGCDTDWFRRALQSGVPCAVVGQVMMYKRIHGSNLSADPRQNRRDMLRIIQKRRHRSAPP